MPQMQSMAVPTRVPLVISPENRNDTTNTDAKLVNCYVEVDRDRNTHLFRRPGMRQWGIPPLTTASGMGTYWWNGSVYSVFGGILISPPTGVSAATSTSGGTLTAGTYYYVVTAVTSSGETVASAEVSITTTGSTSKNTITWTSMGGSITYKIYRGTTPRGESTFYSTGASPFVDTGATGTSGSPPAGNTATSGVLYKGLSQVAVGLDITGGVYSFNSIMGSTPKLVLQNGKAGYAYDDVNRLTAPLHNIDANYPQYTCKGLSYLDGYTFVLQHFFGTSITPAVVWGSTINSVDVPGDWDPLDFITAQMSPDSGVYLAKQLVYVVCLKEWSTEFFYDAGQSTGSPLAPAMNLRLSYGCAAQDSVQTIADVLFWISNNREASNQIVMVEKAQLSVISTPEIDRLLRDADLSIVYSWHIKIDGHSFYVLTIKNNNLTLAYDVNQNRWSQWTDSNGNYVPIVCSTRDQSGNTILQHETSGALYYGSTDNLSDNGQIIPITVVTPRWDAGTSRKKHLSMMNFVCDIVPGSLMTVQVSDDDYVTWSQPRVVDLSMKFPNLPNCGTFRRRSWKFQVNNNLPWRLEAAELQFDLGTL